MIQIKKGLDLPITGKPVNDLDNAARARNVAVIGADYAGMKPTMNVQVGDTVKIGQKLFECKKNTGLIFTAPAAGKVVAINRGERRVFQSLVIEVASTEEHQAFASYKEKAIADYTGEEVRALLVESGLFTALRRRPYDKVALVNEVPEAIFVTAMDTRPGAPDVDFILESAMADFKDGVAALSKLTEGKTFVCKAPGSKVEAPAGANIVTEEFKGPHPAGNPGTHIHYLSPVSLKSAVWYIGYQDVVALGRLIKSGKLSVDRVIALSGPQVKRPRLLRTRLGAEIESIVGGELKEGDNRVVSGSVLYGRKASGPFAFLSRYTNQVSAVKEGREREFLGWHAPGFDKFSVKRTFFSKLIPGKFFDLNTNIQGSPRAMVPVGTYEAVMPLDILPTQLLRSIMTKDLESAEALGALELAEEDLALCTFVSVGKDDFGPILRHTLDAIEKENSDTGHH